MKQSAKSTVSVQGSTVDFFPTESVPCDFIPSQGQVETLAKRLTPEIKRYFADGQVQQEFAAWQARQKNAA